MGQTSFVRQLFYSQAALYATLLICIILSPASLTANSGISYFGHHHTTVVPFIAGFSISDYFLLRAWRLLRNDPPYRGLLYGLTIIIPGMGGIIVAPAIGNGLLDLLHRIFGSIVFISELILGIWLVRRKPADLTNYFLWAVQLSGGIIAFIYLSPPTGYSIEGQLLFQLAFSVLLLRSFAKTKAPAS